MNFLNPHDWPPAVRAVGNVLFDGPFANLWPLFAAPFVACLLSDRTARLLPRTPGAWIPAALLVLTPALVTAGVVYPALTDIGIVKTWRGVVEFWVTPGVAIAMVAYAVMRAALRQREVARLFRAAVAPGPRLAAAAARLGFVARELPTDARDCFVAGLFCPTVFISRGALSALGEEELEAALCHERAHVRGRDTLLLFLLSFLRDLAPWGSGAALEAFQTAREATADREAASRAGSLSLAAALVALARPGPTPAGVLPMAKRDTLRWRMQALLDDGQPEPQNAWARVAGGLGLNAMLVAWPMAQFELMELFCSGFR
jgi:Zn-dependent protease with chaperone function